MTGDERESEEGATGEAAPEIPAAEVAESPPERVYTEADLEARLAAAALEAKDRLLRVTAEYENFRRRVQREKEQWTGEAIERFATDLLGVLDDFDRALAVKSESADAVAEGIRLTDRQLRAVLARHGMECVDPVGQRFDPKLHEAIQRVPAAEDRQPGTVAAVFEKGWTLRGKLLRPARVQVAGEI